MLGNIHRAFTSKVPSLKLCDVVSVKSKESVGKSSEHG